MYSNGRSVAAREIEAFLPRFGRRRLRAEIEERAAESGLGCRFAPAGGPAARGSLILTIPPGAPEHAVENLHRWSTCTREHLRASAQTTSTAGP